MFQFMLIAILFGASILYIIRLLWRAFRIPKQGECGGSCACSTPTKAPTIIPKQLQNN